MALSNRNRKWDQTESTCRYKLKVSREGRNKNILSGADERDQMHIIQ